MKKKNIIALLCSIIFVIITMILAGYLWLKDQLQQGIIFTNDSKYSVDLVKVNFSGEKLTLKGIQPQ